ncbi:trace amine-associated receptor 8c [Hydra vulgaris]|uniref:Trace amine-associated receptor 8c n=1 Tax=Hydra vulgaris TaxID=6087 RepID=A0ABM4BP26_HYDVU
MENTSYFQIFCSFASLNYSLRKSYQVNVIASMTTDAIIAMIIVSLNVVVLYTICKYPSLHTPSNYIILQTAAFDILVGVCSIPMRMVYLYFTLRKNVTCFLFGVMVTINHSLGMISFIMVFVITIDRCVAIFYPFYYHRAVIPKKKRCFSISASVFIFVIVMNSCFIAISKLQFLIYFEICLMIICLKGSLFAYAKIKYLTITITQKYQSNSILSINSIRSECKSKREKRGNLIAFFSLFLLILCYLPFMIVFIIPIIYTDHDENLLNIFKDWSFTISSSKSMVNPLIYCFSIPTIRKRIFKKWAMQSTLSIKEKNSMAVIFKEKDKIPKVSNHQENSS